MSIVNTFSDTSALYDQLLIEFQEKASAAIRSKGEFVVAVCGGSSPIKFFERLHRIEFDSWSKVSFFWVDERWVDQSDSQSNFGSALRSGLNRIPANFFPIPTTLSDPHSAAREYGELIDRYLSEKRFDWILLGVGTDGHIASLFNASDLKLRDNVVVTKHPDTGQIRISLSLAMLVRSHTASLLIVGSEKRNMLRQVQQNQNQTLPVMAFLQLNEQVVVMTDIADGL